MINNLIVIPVKVNGTELNFLLDTGVRNTIMFNLSVEDSVKLKNTRTVRIRGLGEGSYINAVQSKGNLFEIGKVINSQHMIFLIPGKEFDLSARMGVDINGIIGGDLFSDFVIDINYSTKRVKFYNPQTYAPKKCKKCEIFDLTFNRGKPYIDIKVRADTNLIDTKLLIDTGGSKYLWLFDKSSDEIELPANYFDDFLGKGLSGNIFGRRSKIDEIIIGNYRFKNANVAFPDSASIATAYRFKERNGSLGAGILKRFKLVFDYRNSKFIIKGKSTFFKEPFLYNMSGIELIHAGTMLVKDKKNPTYIGYAKNNEGDSRSIVQIIYEYVYDFKPMYRISLIRKDSPAFKAGLLKNDIVLEVNGKAAYQYELQEITNIFSDREGKRIKLLIERNGKKMIYSFRLEDSLK
ncbi:MAG: PDZ domain-containing protein [Flavobacteriaceae bacterium]|nr:PDZ domain-containing protein [Flavobacteriaceae bacterium]